MYPTIKDKDLLEVHPVDAGSINLGDVLLCQLENSRLIAHRVVEIDRSAGQTTVVMKGDALNYLDGLISQTRIIGRVAVVRRGERRISLRRLPYRFAGVVWSRFFCFSQLYLFVKNKRKAMVYDRE